MGRVDAPAPPPTTGGMRSLWSGTVTFGLVSIPVGVYAAVESAKEVHFRQLHRTDMAPIRYKKFCSEEDVEVSNDEIVRGYEVRKGEYAPVEKEELEKVRDELGHGENTIEIVQFVDFASLNPLFFERPYYLSPGRGGAKAYEVLRSALLDERRAGIARFYFRTRPLLAALMPGPKVLSLEVMREFDEVRAPADLGAGHAKATAAERKMARSLIDSMSATWDPTAHPNTYRKALDKLLATKKVVVPERPAAGEGGRGKGRVVDLMAALKASLGTRGAHTAPARAPRRHGRRRRRHAA
jgi:DNA end-binding protein Ku